MMSVNEMDGRIEVCATLSGLDFSTTAIPVNIALTTSDSTSGTDNTTIAIA